jgi:type IV pilus assembly protein PilM
MARDDKPESVWKKELSFRRKPAQDAADTPEPGNEPASEAAAAGGASVWKKEISFRKKAKDATDAPAQPEPAVAAEAQPEPEVDLYALLPELVFEPEPEPEAQPEPVPVAALEPVPAVEHAWLTEPLEEVSEPPAEPLQLVAQEEPLPEPELSLELELDEVHLDLELPPVEVEVDAVAELLPELPPEVAAEVLAEVALEPDVEPEAKVPFYKKELSLKRTPGERKPKPAKAEKARKPKRERPAKPERVEAEAGEKVPFYKRELSLKRSAKQWDAAEPPSEPKPKEPKAAKAAKAPKQERPKLRRPPRPKPSLPSLPSLSRGGAKTFVGLKIGGSQIAAARVSNGSSPELVQAVREPLEHGIVVGGELRDPEALAVALKNFFNRHKLPKRGVRLGIANNRIGVRTFEVAGIADPKQLANAIRFRAQEVLPIPLEEAVLDYQVLSESVNEEGQPVRRVLLVVAYRELVDRYVYACRKAGLQIVGIDLEAFALLRAIAEPHDPIPGSERGALVAVSVGHDRSTFAVSDGRVCEFTRVLEWGGWSLNIAIARALDKAPSEVEEIKRALSFAGTVEAPEGVTEDRLQTAREAARKQLQTFARELVSSLQFYQNQPGSLGIGEIVLTGGTAHLPGLGPELERLIGVPVRVADPLTRLKVSKKVRDTEQLGSLAVAIGLGIED